MLLYLCLPLLRLCHTKRRRNKGRSLHTICQKTVDWQLLVSSANTGAVCHSFTALLLWAHPTPVEEAFVPNWEVDKVRECLNHLRIDALGAQI